jgi:hypothetical protein
MVQRQRRVPRLMGATTAPPFLIPIGIVITTAYLVLVFLELSNWLPPSPSFPFSYHRILLPPLLQVHLFHKIPFSSC